MAKRKDLPTAEDGQTPPTGKKRRHWAWRLLRATCIVALVLMAVRLLIGQLYHGPRDKAAVVAAMPGVPLFPLSEMSPGNERAQRALALPLWFLRFQGAQRAEAAQLLAPADAEFIIEWYRHVGPTQGWEYIGKGRVASGARLIFLRGNDGLQITLGQAKDQIATPLQLIYLQGLSDRQKAQLSGAVPRDTSPRPLRVTGPVAPPKPAVTQPEQTKKPTDSAASPPTGRAKETTRRQPRTTSTNARQRNTAANKSTGSERRQAKDKARPTTTTTRPTTRPSAQRERTTAPPTAERKRTTERAPTYAKPTTKSGEKTSPDNTRKGPSPSEDSP